MSFGCKVVCGPCIHELTQEIVVPMQQFLELRYDFLESEVSEKPIPIAKTVTRSSSPPAIVPSKRPVPEEKPVQKKPDFISAREKLVE
jgi:hypothetical protein